VKDVEDMVTLLNNAWKRSASREGTSRTTFVPGVDFTDIYGKNARTNAFGARNAGGTTTPRTSVGRSLESMAKDLLICTVSVKYVDILVIQPETVNVTTTATT